MLELRTLGGFVLSAGFFTAALDDDSPPLDAKRWACLGGSGALLCVVLLSRVQGWLTLLSGLAFLMSVAVLALAAYAERSRRESRTMALEPEWWPQFARDFEAYVHLASPEERRDDSHRA